MIDGIQNTRKETQPCASNHDQIMSELKRIQERMDKDWELIDAAHRDLEFRNRIWGIVRWIGFGTSAGLVLKMSEYLAKITG